MTSGLKDQLFGALMFLGLVLAGFLVWEGVQEYRYYQVMKKEHQEFFLEPVGKTSDGRSLTRKMFFDMLLAETARAQAKGAKKE